MIIPNGKKIYLCSPNLDKLCVLNGLQTDTVDFHPQIKAYSELSFTVDRYISINDKFVLSNGYEELKPHMYLYLEDIGYFIMEAAQVLYDGIKEVKEITAYSAEKEFEYRDWVGIKINCGTPDSMEYANTDDSNKDDTQAHFAINYVKLVDNDNHNLSFLHQILLKVTSRWTIQYVSPLFEADGKLPAIEISSQNLYAVMTSEVGPRMKALFVFDYLHFGIRVFHRDELDGDYEPTNAQQTRLDLDTGIFVGFRNLANSVNITVDNNSIYTRFTVQGDGDLDFRDINYGDNTIINLEYFLGYPYMDDTLVEKIRAWQQFREDHINEYIEYAKRTNSINEKIYDLKYKVPSDETYWKNWDSMSEEGLNENLEYYEDYLKELQEVVDERPDAEKYTDDTKETYLPKMINGEVDHEYYRDLLYDQIDIYSGYYTYIEIQEYILPYIRLALSNLNKVEKESPEYEVTTDWELYGQEELEGTLESYKDKIATLQKYSKDWNLMTNEEKAELMVNYADDDAGTNYEQLTGRIEYKKLKERIGDESTPGTILYQLKIIKDEIAAYEAEIKELTKLTNAYAHLMKIDYSYLEYKDEIKPLSDSENQAEQDLVTEREEFVLDEDELITIMSLLKDTDYVNTNVVYTPLVMTTDDKFDQEQILYDDAVDKLSEVSQPQFKFSVDADNFFRLEEYTSWANEFLPTTESVSLGLLRFVHLGIRDHYSVKLRVIGYRWNPCEVTPDLTLEFSNMITSNSGRSDLVQLLDTENQRASKNSIKIGNGTADSAQEYVSALVDAMKKSSVFNKYIKNIIGDTSIIGEIDQSLVELIVKDYIGANPPAASSVNAADITNLTGDFIVSRVVEAEQGNFNALSAKIINAISISAQEGNFKTLSTQLLSANEAYIRELSAGNVTAESIQTALLSATKAEIDELYANTASFNHLTAMSTAFLNSVNKNAFIEYLTAKQITVNDLIGNTIVLSDHMTIASENGSMIMDGTKLQISGTDTNGNSYVGIQLGYDTSHQPSLILRNSDGSIVLTPQGITADAIADELIDNGMIKTATIDKTKLNFNVLEPNSQGGIDITQVFVNGESDNFGVIYSSFKNETLDFISQTRNNMKSVELEGQNVFKEVNGAITPASITINAVTKSGAVVNKWYIDGVVDTTHVALDNNSITIPSSMMANKQTLLLRVECVDSDVTDNIEPPFDVMTITKLSDGDSPYSVILNSASGELFKEDSTTRVTCTVYRGSTVVTPSAYTWHLTVDGVAQSDVQTTVNYIDVPVSSSRVITIVNCSVTI